MYTSTFLTILAAASSAIATPLNSKRSDAGDAFTLISIRSGSDLQNAAISATDYGLWVGKSTTSSCPDSVGTACPEGTVTAFTAQEYSGINMDSEVPGGQKLYVGTDGTVSYSIPHSAELPAGAIISGFTYNEGTGGAVGTLTLENVGFVACPDSSSTSIYQIFATAANFTRTDCLGINLGAVAYTDSVAAWEYN